MAFSFENVDTHKSNCLILHLQHNVPCAYNLSHKMYGFFVMISTLKLISQLIHIYSHLFSSFSHLKFHFQKGFKFCFDNMYFLRFPTIYIYISIYFFRQYFLHNISKISIGQFSITRRYYFYLHTIFFSINYLCAVMYYRNTCFTYTNITVALYQIHTS